MAAHSDSYSERCSETSLTARSLNSAEYLTRLTMKPILSRRVVSGKAGAVHLRFVYCRQLCIQCAGPHGLPGEGYGVLQASRSWREAGTDNNHVPLDQALEFLRQSA